MLGMHLERGLEILRKPLRELDEEYADTPVRIVAIQRGESTKIPHGDDMFLPNDRIFMVLEKSAIDEVIKAFGKEKKSIENVMILGRRPNGLPDRQSAGKGVQRQDH